MCGSAYLLGPAHRNCRLSLTHFLTGEVQSRYLTYLCLGGWDGKIKGGTKENDRD